MNITMQYIYVGEVLKLELNRAPLTTSDQFSDYTYYLDHFGAPSIITTIPALLHICFLILTHNSTMEISYKTLLTHLRVSLVLKLTFGSILATISNT